MRRLVTAAATVLLVSVALAAQQPPDPPKPAPVAPTVSDLDKKQIENLSLRMENAQLRAQQAQAAFDQARRELAALVQALQRDGYDLDLATLTYTKKPEPKKAPTKDRP